MPDQRESRHVPYKVVAYEPGAADVIDRATGEKVGYVLAAFRGWEAFLCSARGVNLTFGTWHDARINETFTLIRAHSRAGAAAKVWECHQEAMADA